MDKIKKVISANSLALFGWFNIILQSRYIREILGLDLSRAGAGDILFWMFVFHMGINIVFILIAAICWVFEYIHSYNPNAKWAFKFPYEKIRPQILYNIFFFGGLIGIVLPLIAITLFTILQ